MSFIRVEWPAFKTFIDSRRLMFQGIEFDTHYLLRAGDNFWQMECHLTKTPSDTAHLDEFVASYKESMNKAMHQSYPDGRQIVHSTPRKRGLITNFTARDDDQTDATKVGGGANVMAVKHAIGEPLVHTLHFDLNTIANETYLHSGTIQWEKAALDTIDLLVVPKTTVYAAGTGTNYNLFGGYLITPAAPGAGAISVADADRVLVQIPLNEYGNKTGAGYWDATFNTTTKAFEGITPNYAGTGAFNMFGAAVQLDRFVHHQPLVGAGVFTFHSSDASMLGHGMRLKLVTTTVGTDHEWTWCVSLVLHRKKTV